MVVLNQHDLIQFLSIVENDINVGREILVPLAPCSKGSRQFAVSRYYERSNGIHGGSEWRFLRKKSLKYPFKIQGNFPENAEGIRNIGHHK
jgi:hypothetical protein